jgi:TolA-binding protein
LFSPSVRARIILLALIICLAAAASVQAKGNAERESRRRLAEVEKLIAEKRYNEAVRLLSEVVQEDPDRFDAAEELMAQIRNSRAEIDERFAQLNEALQENDEQKVVALIDDIEKLNPYPNDTEAHLLEMIRAAGIERIYFVNLFRDLMDRAREQIRAGEYRQAVSTYLELFGEDFRIVRENFDEEEYGNILKNSVETALSNLQEAIGTYDALTGALVATAENFGADPQELPAAVEAVAGLLESMAAEVGTVESSGRTFQVQNERVKENSADGEYDLFLFFADEVVLGPEEESTEGIAYALDAIWRGELGDLESVLLERGQAAYNAVVERFRKQSLEAALAFIEPAEALFPSLLDLQALWPLRVEPTRPYPSGEAGRSAFASAAPGMLRTQEYMKALEDYRNLIQTNERIVLIVEKEVTTIQQVYSDREELEELLVDMENLDSSWRNQLARYREGARQGLDLTGHVSQAEEVISDIGATLEVAKALDMRLLDRVARVQGVEFEDRFRSYKDLYEQAVQLQEGREVVLESIRNPETGEIIETATRVEKYPSQAVAIFRPLSRDLKDLAEGVDAMLANALKNQEYVEQSEELQVHVRSLRSLVDRIAQLQGDLEPRLQDSEQAALQAERYRREGQLRFQQARANVDSGRYADARQNIRSAREAFDNSLSFEEDEEVRRIRDEELVALSRAIVDLENNLVIAEVRSLIEAGRRLYAQGDFAGAEQTLLAAQARWSDTNPTVNPEVSFWLGLVRSAVDATTGREIAETDPLYKEMSQLYNLALRDFQTGQELIAQDKRGEALRVLRRAEDRIAKILVPFPYNARARVLTLRILQISDPEAFRARITDLYNEAQRRRSDSPQEAYAILKDIEQLQPNYPGLQSAIANLEIALGFRIPPPDPAKIAQSRDLYLQARSIWDRNQRDLFASALDVLNEAIQLNPDNRDAAALKDRLLIATGGERVDVLSSDDQRLLREAEAKYLSGDYFEALVIIEQLLRKPSNQNNQEILDLEKRVRAKTG